MNEIVSLLTAVRNSGLDILTAMASLADRTEASRGFADETLIYGHLAMFSGDPRHLPLAINLATRICRHDLLARLLEIKESFREPESPLIVRRPEHVDDKFREYCRRHGVTILRQLQVGAEGRESCRSVFLVLDEDGLVKIFKELRLPETSRLGLIADESEVYECVGPVRGLPRYYGTTEIEDVTFMRMSVCYGRTLDEFNFLLPEQAAQVVGHVAASLSRLHDVGVVYNDLRTSNVKIDGDDVYLLDLGDAQFMGGATEVTTYVHGPRHVAPEIVLRHKAQPASDVFQLGVIWHELLTGRHPFSGSLPGEDDYDLLRLRDCLANVMLLPSTCGVELLDRMLDADPTRRPSAAEVAETLMEQRSRRGEEGVSNETPASSVPVRASVQARGLALSPSQVRTSVLVAQTKASNGTVLFPARIGIPHRGHIDFIARLIELGYEVVVSLNAAYVLTPLDPLPKWMVMKMIGRSLELRGLSTRRVRFVCAPLFDNDADIGLHYALMPGVEKIVAVASGNQDAHRLFEGRWPIIDQAALFAHEGEDYETRSWGHRLREAVRRNDRATFDDLIAPGAEEILSFDEMRVYCSGPTQVFAWGRERGRVSVVLRDADSKELVKQRVSNYSTPEDAVVMALGASFVDRFTRNSIVKIRSRNATLVFEHTAFEDQNLTINYRLEDA